MNVYFNLCDCEAIRPIEMSCIPSAGDQVWIKFDIFNDHDKDWLEKNSDLFDWLDDDTVVATVLSNPLWDLREEPKCFIHVIENNY